MSWEPDTEELRLGIARKEINDLKSQTSFSANPISVGSSSNAMGSNSGTASMNQGSNGDVVKDITNIVTTVSENSISWIVGAIDAVGSLFTVKPDPATTGTIEPTADCATIRTLSGGVDGQKITLKPEKNKKICLMHNPVTNTSAIGNLLLGGVDVTITDPEMITLRFTTEVGSLYKDSYLNNVLPIIPTPASPQTPPPVLLIPKGGWLIESIGEGNTIVGSNRVVKDPVKVATTANVTNLTFSSPIDGIAMTVGDRFLVKDQTNTVDNGIYIWASGSASTRSTDMASGSTQKEGTMTYIQDGTEAERLYAINIGGNTIVMGTSANTWGEIGNAGANQTLSNLTVGSVAVNTDLTPAGNEVEDLGSTSNVWRRLYAKDIYSTGNIRTEATDDELEFYTGGGKRLGLSVSASSPFNGVAELFGANANFKTMATTVGSANAEIGGLVFDGYDSAVVRQSFASVVGISENVSSGVEDGKLKFKVKRAGTTKEMLEINTIGIRLPTASLANPSDNGTIFLSGSDVKIRSGGNNVNISTVGTDILPLSNTFTGAVNTFSNATGTFQASTPIVNLGTGSGNINILGTANLTGTLDMNDNMITDITLAGIVDAGSTSRGSISGDSTQGLVINGALITMLDVTTNIATFAKHNSGDIDFYADLDMHTYDMTSLDRLKFSTTQGSGTALGTSDTGIEATYSGGSSYGMKLVVPTNNIYQMFIGSSEKLTITTSSTVLNNPVSIGGYLSIGDNYMEYGDTTSTLVGTTPANKRRVFSDENNNDELSVKLPNGNIVSLEGGGGTSFIGFTADDNLNMGTFDVTNIDRMLFEGALGGSLVSGDVGITSDADGMIFNVPTADDYSFSVAMALPFLTFNSTGFLYSGGTFQANTGVVNLGTGAGSINLLGDIASTGKIDMNANEIRFDGMVDPSQIVGEPQLFADSSNSDHLSIMSGDGTLYDLESSGGGGATQALDNLSGVNINASLTPAGTSWSLGSTSKFWGSAFISGSVYLGDTTKKIYSSGSDIITYAPSGGDIKFQEAGNNFFVCDGGSNEIIFTRGVEFNEDTLVDSGSMIRSHDSIECGFSVSKLADVASIGTEGTMQIPWLGTFSGSRSATDTDFGNGHACIGIMESAGTPYLMVKSSNGGWYGIGLSLYYA